jgi:rSAM/selenodomain-associated transferase 1
LGEKLQSALLDSHNHRISRVVFIGVDCPDLNTEILDQAFADLDTSDVVIGPAVDGGYYLIGLSRFLPELFDGITWGTDIVFKQTEKIAQSLGLVVNYLPILRDVDRPEDL